MEMTVEELKGILDGYPDDTIVRFAHQPSWPLEYTISDRVVLVEGDDAGPDFLYLAEESQIGYLPGTVASELGWGR